MARNLELYLAWIFASIGTLLSLYISEVRNLEPCRSFSDQPRMDAEAFYRKGVVGYRVRDCVLFIRDSSRPADPSTVLFDCEWRGSFTSLPFVYGDCASNSKEEETQ